MALLMRTPRPETNLQSQSFVPAQRATPYTHILRLLKIKAPRHNPTSTVSITSTTESHSTNCTLPSSSSAQTTTTATSVDSSPLALTSPIPSSDPCTIKGYAALAIGDGYFALTSMAIPAQHLQLWSHEIRVRLVDEIEQTCRFECHPELSMVYDVTGRGGPCILLTVWNEVISNDARKVTKFCRKVLRRIRELQTMQTCPFPCKVVFDKISLAWQPNAIDIDSDDIQIRTDLADLNTYVGLSVTSTGVTGGSCTLGGLLEIDSQIFGLTAAHALVTRPVHSPTDSANQGTSAVISDEEDEEDYDDNDSDHNPLQGSLFDGYDHSYTLEHNSQIRMNANGYLNGTDQLANQYSILGDLSAPNRSSCGQISSQRDTKRTVPYSIGTVFLTSSSESRDNDNRASENDWALIKLSSGVKVQANRYRLFGALEPTELSAISSCEPTPGTQAFIVTDPMSPIKCVIGQSDIEIVVEGLRLSVVQIMVADPLGPGVSGTWVVQGQEVIGSIVAVCKLRPIVYMVHMKRIIQDLSRLGVKKVSCSIRGTRLPEMEDIDPGIRSSTTAHPVRNTVALSSTKPDTNLPSLDDWDGDTPRCTIPHLDNQQKPFQEIQEKPGGGLALDNNFEYRLGNPLRSMSPHQLDSEARKFARMANGSEHLFTRAALLAQRPWLPDTSYGESNSSGYGRETWDEAERAALWKEQRKGFWKQSKHLKLTVITLGLCAVTQGWVQTGLSNPSWAEEFGIQDLTIYQNSTGRGSASSGSGQPSSTTSAFGSRGDFWIFAGMHAVVFLVASLFGCWLSKPLQVISIPNCGSHGRAVVALGRRGVIFSFNCLIFASLVGAACSHNWKQLFICRSILGLGVGAVSSITPVYTAEISPPHLRGALGLTWQICNACGVFIGMTANLILYRIGPLSWRFQVASGCIPTVCLLALIWAIPESPRWLLKENRIPKAFANMCLLRHTPLQAAREIFYIYAHLRGEKLSLSMKRSSGSMRMPHNNVLGNDEQYHQEAWSQDENDMSEFQEALRIHKFIHWTRLRLLTNNTRNRRATIAAVIVMLGQQLCGFNVLASYSTTYFRDVAQQGYDSSTPLWFSWGFALASLLFMLPGLRVIDTRGRRFLLLVTYPFMFLSLLFASISFLFRSDTVRSVALACSLFAFLLFNSLGQEPIAFAYCSEVFTSVAWEVGMSLGVSMSFLAAGLLALLTPLVQAVGRIDTSEARHAYNRKQAGLLGLFAALNGIFFVLIFLFVPETGGGTVAQAPDGPSYLSLEELNYVFSMPTRSHVRYQIRCMLPYISHSIYWVCYGRWFGARKPRTPEKLYEWDETTSLGYNA